MIAPFKMPYTAKLLSEKINLLQCADPEVYRGKDIRCNGCGNQMVLVSGSPFCHFRHFRDESCIYSGEPETREHLSLKEKVYSSSSPHFLTAEMEARIEGKEVDVLLDGRIAIECQISSCQIDYVAVKNEIYRNAGLYPFWLFYTERNYEEYGQLNRLLKTAFCDQLGNPYGLVPYVALYLAKKDKILIPQFKKTQVKNVFSPIGYRNEWKVINMDESMDWNEFMSFLKFYAILLCNPPA